MAKHPALAALEDRLLRPQPDLTHLTARQQFERIMAKVADMPEAVISPEDLLQRLQAAKDSGTPLKVKLGIDPTGPEIHVGHAVALLNLRLFQRMGHRIQLVIGDFTGMIGDPSGRMDDRPALTAEDIRRNMASYDAQAARVIDLQAASVERHYNSDWMMRLDMRQWVGIIRGVSVSALLQREDFRSRIAAGHGLSLAEVEYALFMGYDSVVLQPDLELGGMDQYLNLHMCRQMMGNAGQRPEIVMTYNLLAGTSGERDEHGRLVKMSKSRGNYIPVTAPPADMYGKVMSVPDEVMWVYFRELTEIEPEQLGELKDGVAAGRFHPKDVKHLLARVLVATFNFFDAVVVAQAEADFNAKFGKQAVLVPDTAQVVTITEDGLVLDVLARTAGRSKTEIRRLVSQNGIRMLRQEQYVPITAEELTLPCGHLRAQVLRVGKRHFYRFEA